MSPDLEVVISLRPSFVMVSPFPDITYSQIRNAGIAVVPNAGYMENTPLGRAEWMVFVAALFGKEGKAVPLFDEIENRYLATKNIAKNAAGRPSLFSGNLYQGVWHASMGNNYMSQYFTDAGANYIYKHVAGTGTLSLEFEKIFHDASLTEYWLLILNHPGEIDYETIEQIDPRYTSFKAFKDRKIIFTNADHSLFFEKSEQEPDVVLADITHALHPELNPEYHPVYFKVLR
jgi:iron complex transport system substrate-binding protein